MVKVLNLGSLEEAFEKAMLHEISLEALFKSTKNDHKSYYNVLGPKSPNITSLKSNSDVDNSKVKSTKGEHEGLSTSDFEARRKTGLCYKCGEKFTMGHRCNEKMLHSMRVIEEDSASEGIEG